MPKLCGRVGAVAIAVLRQSCADTSDGSYGCVAPKLCTVERTGQEAAAKIGVILALRSQTDERNRAVVKTGWS